VRGGVVRGRGVGLQTGDVGVPRYAVEDVRAGRERAARERRAVGLGRRVAEEDVDGDRVVEQVLVDRDGVVDHRLYRCGVPVARDRAVERGVDDEGATAATADDRPIAAGRSRTLI